LLRALETREVIPLGATQPIQVDFALVSATHRDLRARVAARKLREDLFFRIARPEVRLPPLRERAEEIPWLVAAAIQEAEATWARANGSPELRAHVSLIEACLTRAWPGNVRELLSEVRTAAQEARSTGSLWVNAEHLSPSAGQSFAPERAPASSPRGSPQPKVAPPARRASSLPEDTIIEAALQREGGNLARTARALGMHRTQLRRWLARRTDGTDEGS
jgi:DNA-binding NtrC family response regulator